MFPRVRGEAGRGERKPQKSEAAPLKPVMLIRPVERLQSNTPSQPIHQGELGQPGFQGAGKIPGSRHILCP